MPVEDDRRLMQLLALSVLRTRRYSELMDMLNMVPLSRSSVTTRLSAAYLRILLLLYTTAIRLSRLILCRTRNLTVAAMPRRPMFVLSSPPDIVRTIMLPKEHSCSDFDLRDGATDGLMTRPCV